MIPKAAITGSEAYHTIMRQAATDGLQQAAGYVPKRGVFVNGGCEHVGEMLFVGMPKPEWNQIDLLSLFFKGYGWIAGSSVLWRYLMAQDGDCQWGYNDIDVFCHTESAYETLHEMYKSELVAETKHNFKVDGFGFIIEGHGRIWMECPLNVCKPRPTQNWIYPQNVLSNFDLSICALAMIQPGVIYALYPQDLKDSLMHYHKSEWHGSTLRRAFKYMKRGFRPDSYFWMDMASDDKNIPQMKIFSALAELKKDEVAGLIENIATWANIYGQDYDGTGGDYNDD